MPATTDRVLAFAKEAFERHIADLLDDPFWMLQEEPPFDPAAYMAEQHLLAADLGMDFDELVDRLGSPYERERLQKLAMGAPRV